MIRNQNFIERVSCPCCLSSDFDTVYDCPFEEDPIRQYLRDFYDPQGGVEVEYLHGASFVLRQCRNCSLIFQAQIGSEFLLKKLYEEWIDPSVARDLDDKRRNLQYHVGYAEEIITVVAHLQKVPADVRVLDFGMGWGRWCRMARGFGCQAYGTELSEERKIFARNQGIIVVSWDEIPDQNFDLINTEQVFEHLANPLETLEHLATGLSPDGLIKISVPNGGRIPVLLKQPDWAAPKGSPRSLNPIAPLEHINCFNHEALVSLANKAGLILVSLGWSTRIEIVPRLQGLRGLRKRLGRVKRAMKALVSSYPAHESGTCLFFQKSSRVAH